MFNSIQELMTNQCRREFLHWRYNILEWNLDVDFVNQINLVGLGSHR